MTGLAPVVCDECQPCDCQAHWPLCTWTVSLWYRSAVKWKSVNLEQWFGHRCRSGCYGGFARFLLFLTFRFTCAIVFYAYFETIIFISNHLSANKSTSHSYIRLNSPQQNRGCNKCQVCGSALTDSVLIDKVGIMSLNISNRGMSSSSRLLAPNLVTATVRTPLKILFWQYESYCQLTERILFLLKLTKTTIKKPKKSPSYPSNPRNPQVATPPHKNNTNFLSNLCGALLPENLVIITLITVVTLRTVVTLIN